MKRKTLKVRILPLLLLFAVLSTSFASGAEPELLFNEGFEHWQISMSQENGVMNYEMVCSEADLPVNDLENYVLYIMSYCREKNPSASRVTIRFPYQGASFSWLSSAVQKMFSIEGGIRAVSSSFMNLSSCRLQSDNSGGVKTVIFQLDVNNPSSGSIYARDIPFGESLEAVRSLAARIQAQSSEPQEQLRLLNDYLIENVTYGHVDEKERAYSPIGTLLDGVAVCSGYSSTVNDVCYLLGIPAYQLYDRPNSHIWNVVYLDGRWLMLDTTANDTGGVAERFFLQPDFHDEHHSYDDATKRQLAALAMKFNEAGFAAQRLNKAGIIQGNGAGDFALAEVLTYEALAVVLTRLDDTETSVQANGSAYSILAKNSGNQPWALPYLGYCMAQGYFDKSLNLDTDNLVTTAVAAQIMIRYAVATKAISLNSVPTMGEYLLRGDFFRMVADWSNG